MKKIQKKRSVPYSAQALYALVNDVASYPEFLPWCKASEVLEASETHMLASLTLSAAGLTQSFTTENTLNAPHQIDMKGVSDPFRSLTSRWRFHAVNETTTHIEFEFDCEFDGFLLKMTLGPIIEQIANQLVDAFCQRADALYGK